MNHGWGIGWGWIIGLIFLAVIIWMIVKMVKKNNPNLSKNKTPLDVLKERYARGEIGKGEYKEKKRDIL